MSCPSGATSRAYALRPTGSGIAAPGAWDSRTNCTLDSGAQAGHPDLKPNMWHNPDEINNNGKDDDHNGWVDDYYGVNLPAGNGSGSDDDGHGTHVAGIIAGRSDNAARLHDASAPWPSPWPPPAAAHAS